MTNSHEWSETELKELIEFNDSWMKKAQDGGIDIVSLGLLAHRVAAHLYTLGYARASDECFDQYLKICKQRKTKGQPWSEEEKKLANIYYDANADELDPHDLNREVAAFLEVQGFQRTANACGFFFEKERKKRNSAAAQNILDSANPSPQVSDMMYKQSLAPADPAKPPKSTKVANKVNSELTKNQMTHTERSNTIDGSRLSLGFPASDSASKPVTSAQKLALASSESIYGSLPLRPAQQLPENYTKSSILAKKLQSAQIEMNRITKALDDKREDCLGLDRQEGEEKRTAGREVTVRYVKKLENIESDIESLEERLHEVKKEIACMEKGHRSL